MPLVINYFPASLMELQAEIAEHPQLLELVTRLSSDPRNDFYTKIAHIAAYCNIAVDGSFDDDEITALGRLCLERLRSRRRGSDVIVGVSDSIMRHH